VSITPTGPRLVSHRVDDPTYPTSISSSNKGCKIQSQKLIPAEGDDAAAVPLFIQNLDLIDIPIDVTVHDRANVAGVKAIAWHIDFHGHRIMLAQHILLHKASHKTRSYRPFVNDPYRSYTLCSPRAGDLHGHLVLHSMRRSDLSGDRLCRRRPKQCRSQNLEVPSPNPKQLPKKRRMVPTHGVIHVQNVLSQLGLFNDRPLPVGQPHQNIIRTARRKIDTPIVRERHAVRGFEPPKG